MEIVLMNAPKFKPCKGCPTPAACKRAGTCMAKKRKGAYK